MVENNTENQEDFQKNEMNETENQENEIKQEPVSQEKIDSLLKEEYEKQMLVAFLGSEKPYYWFNKAFKKYNINGINNFAWNWNWPCFFLGSFYLFYRKIYLYGLGVLIINSLISFQCGLIINILCGGFLPYLIYLQYSKFKKEIEEKTIAPEEKIKLMQQLGGTSNIILIIIGIILFPIIFVLTMFGALFLI